jgi:intein/homing endonuclease
MSEKDSEEFEDDEAEEVVGGDDVDIEFLMQDIDKRKKASPKPGEPAWRRLEKYREEKHTAELLSDFDDYDIGDGEGRKRGRKADF